MWFRKKHVDSKDPMVLAVEHAVSRATKIPRITIAVLVVVAVVLATVVGYLGYKSATHPLANQLKAQVHQNAQITQSLEQYVQEYAQHSCTALELLTSTPVPKPPDPTANPSREATYKFYVALLYWESADHCKPVK